VRGTIAPNTRGYRPVFGRRFGRFRSRPAQRARRREWLPGRGPGIPKCCPCPVGRRCWPPNTRVSDPAGSHKCGHCRARSAVRNRGTRTLRTSHRNRTCRNGSTVRQDDRIPHRHHLNTWPTSRSCPRCSTLPRAHHSGCTCRRRKPGRPHRRRAPWRSKPAQPPHTECMTPPRKRARRRSLLRNTAGRSRHTACTCPWRRTSVPRCTPRLHSTARCRRHTRHTSHCDRGCRPGRHSQDSRLAPWHHNRRSFHRCTACPRRTSPPHSTLRRSRHRAGIALPRTRPTDRRCPEGPLAQSRPRSRMRPTCRGFRRCSPGRFRRSLRRQWPRDRLRTYCWTRPSIPCSRRRPGRNRPDTPSRPARHAHRKCPAHRQAACTHPRCTTDRARPTTRTRRRRFARSDMPHRPNNRRSTLRSDTSHQGTRLPRWQPRSRTLPPRRCPWCTAHHPRTSRTTGHHDHIPQRPHPPCRSSRPNSPCNMPPPSTAHRDTRSDSERAGANTSPRCTSPWCKGSRRRCTPNPHCTRCPRRRTCPCCSGAAASKATAAKRGPAPGHCSRDLSSFARLDRNPFCRKHCRSRCSNWQQSTGGRPQDAILSNEACLEGCYGDDG
jgi:hypothetical protein